MTQYQTMMSCVTREFLIVYILGLVLEKDIHLDFYVKVFSLGSASLWSCGFHRAALDTSWV